MLNELIIDELNVLVEKNFTTNADEMTDYIESLLILGYKMGIEATISELNGEPEETTIEEEQAEFGGDTDIEDYVVDMDIDIDKLQEALFAQIAGQTFEQRVRQYASDGDLTGVKKVAETEFHRMYEQSALETATKLSKEKGKSINKTWFTMLDDKVRDTHDYLEGTTVGLDEKFFTYDGDSALYPSGFENAENNVNCRCTVIYSWS